MAVFAHPAKNVKLALGHDFYPLFSKRSFSVMRFLQVDDLLLQCMASNGFLLQRFPRATMRRRFLMGGGFGVLQLPAQRLRFLVLLRKTTVHIKPIRDVCSQNTGGFSARRKDRAAPKVACRLGT
jgi:hypothetical protein